MACVWCEDEGLAETLIEALTKHDSEDVYKRATPDLFECVACIDGYHQVKSKVGLNEQARHKLFIDFEVPRLTHFITAFLMLAKNKDDFEGVLPGVYELLAYPYLLFEEALFNPFCKEMDRAIQDIEIKGAIGLEDRELWYCGVLLLLFNPREKIRNWASECLHQLKAIDNDNYHFYRSILTCMLKVFVNDHSTATINNSKWVEVIADSTTLPSHFYRGVPVDVLLTAYSVIFSVLQRRTLKMLLMSKYNKTFVEKFLQLLKGANPMSSITFKSGVLLLRDLLDKLDSTFWLLPGDFEESHPLAVFRMLTKHVSFEKKSQELCSVHYESMENKQNIYAYLFQWILPFVRSLVQIHTVCMEVTREALKFHIHLINMNETSSCLFKLAGDSLLAILTYICEINYQFILCHLAKDLGVVLWKLADSKKDNAQDSIYIRVIPLISSIITKGRAKKSISNERHLSFQSNFKKLQSGLIYDPNIIKSAITSVLVKSTKVKLEHGDENGEFVVYQKNLMDKVNQFLIDDTSDEKVLIGNMLDDGDTNDPGVVLQYGSQCGITTGNKNQDMDIDDNTENSTQDCSQSPSNVESDMGDTQNKITEAEVASTVDDEEVFLRKMKQRKRELLITSETEDEKEDATEPESDNDGESRFKLFQEEDIQRMQPTVKVKRVPWRSIPPAARDKELIKQHRHEKLTKLAAEKPKITEEKNSANIPHKKVPVVRQCSSVLRRERIEKDLSLFVKPSTRALPNMKTTLKYNLPVFTDCILNWQVEWLDKKRDELVIDTQIGSVPFTFESYDCYMKTFWHLMLLETWAQIVKEWCEVNKTVVLCIKNAEKSGIGTPLDCLVCSIYDEENKLEELPVDDDLLYLKFGNQQGGAKRFGIVIKIEKAWVPATQKSNPKNQSQQNYFKLFTVSIRVKDPETLSRCYSSVAATRITSLTTVFRQWNGLIAFPTSLLAPDILKPFREATYCSYKNAITKTERLIKLNPFQFEIVSNATQATSEPYPIPKIGLLQGPPGTGKSYTVKTIVTHLLQEFAKNAPAAGTYHRDRILVCAPSNAAVDEIVSRLILSPPRKPESERKDRNCNIGDFRLIRVGRRTGDIKPFTLEELTEIAMRQLREKNSKNTIKNELKKYSEVLEALDADCVKMKMSSNVKEKQEYSERMTKRTAIQQKHDELMRMYCNLSSGKIDFNVEEKKLKRKILLQSDVVCCTLSGAGCAPMIDAFRNYLDKKKPPFRCVIIDEAGQCCEPDALIPLQYKSSKLILVGDPAQLPATVFSQKAARYNYGQSLFERLYSALMVNNKGNQNFRPAVILKTQYRMAPEICKFPSRKFYNGELHCSREVLSRNKKILMKPYVLLDICNSNEKKANGGSIHNPTEREHIVALCEVLKERGYARWTGIITPYKMQKEMLRKEFTKRQFDKFQIDTVDAYQGKEKGITILSCVRANSAQGNIGFLINPQRMNVALTRAIESLVILAHCQSLQGDKDWADLIEDAKVRDVYYKVNTIQDTVRVVFTDKDLSIKQGRSVELDSQSTSSRGMSKEKASESNTNIQGTESKKSQILKNIPVQIGNQSSARASKEEYVDSNLNIKNEKSYNDGTRPILKRVPVNNPAREVLTNVELKEHRRTEPEKSLKGVEELANTERDRKINVDAGRENAVSRIERNIDMEELKIRETERNEEATKSFYSNTDIVQGTFSRNTKTSEERQKSSTCTQIRTLKRKQDQSGKRNEKTKLNVIIPPRSLTHKENNAIDKKSTLSIAVEPQTSKPNNSKEGTPTVSPATTSPSLKRREKPSVAYYKLPHTHTDGTKCEKQCVRLIEREKLRVKSTSVSTTTSASKNQGEPDLEGAGDLSDHFPGKQSKVELSADPSANLPNTAQTKSINETSVVDPMKTWLVSSNTQMCEHKTKSPTDGLLDPRLKNQIADKEFKNAPIKNALPTFPDQRNIKETFTDFTVSSISHLDEPMEITSLPDTPITLDSPAISATTVAETKTILQNSLVQPINHYQASNPYNSMSAHYYNSLANMTLMQNILQTNPNYASSTFRLNNKDAVNFLDSTLVSSLESQTFGELAKQLSEEDRQYLINFAAGFATCVLQTSKLVTTADMNHRSAAAINAIESDRNIIQSTNYLPTSLKNLSEDDAKKLLKILLNNPQLSQGVSFGNNKDADLQVQHLVDRENVSKNQVSQINSGASDNGSNKQPTQDEVIYIPSDDELNLETTNSVGDMRNEPQLPKQQRKRRMVDKDTAENCVSENSTKPRTSSPKLPTQGRKREKKENSKSDRVKSEDLNTGRCKIMREENRSRKHCEEKIKLVFENSEEQILCSRQRSQSELSGRYAAGVSNFSKSDLKDIFYKRDKNDHKDKEYEGTDRFHYSHSSRKDSRYHKSGHSRSWRKR